MSLFYPRATAADLLPISQLVSLAFVIDDAFDDIIPSPAQCHDRLRSLHGVLAGQAPADRWSRALHDVWGRLLEGRPSCWQRAFHRDVSDHLWSPYREVVDRSSGNWPALWSHHENRRYSFGTYFLLDYHEVVTGTFLPEDIRRLPGFSSLRTAVADQIAIVNDVFSCHKEEPTGGHHNFVLLAERHHSCSRSTAIGRAQALADTYLTHAITARTELEDQLAAVSAPHEEQHAYLRVADAHIATIRGNYDYHLDPAVRRYTLPPGGMPQQETAVCPVSAQRGPGTLAGTRAARSRFS
ncbi:terpene synthase family protein [Streptomyces sp. NPDC056323]|uniref:terpene synthase family protein n=1 Tax=Streptomyces sp. NPDC056323 TaxID=3345784 RepID=UPI0035DD604A